MKAIEGLLFESEEYALLDHLVVAGIVYVLRTNGTVPDGAEALAARLHQYVVQYRETEFRVRPQVSASLETMFDSSSFALRSSETTEWLSVRQVAELSGKSEQYVRRLAQKRVLEGDQMGYKGARRLNGNSVAAWLAARRSDQQAA
ncbi:helix-turn-helix domain-containing protein [Streptacidiphilus albus]|uniref:helix-turn-helix domain-containing protein n=1 Tax=Streptacidiphilus albus TaxID=105425 RepID=UPI00054BC148|nr:helix-turn-helix domain-containing protein [Streptacidiphilus albus]